MMQNKELDFVINIPDREEVRLEESDGYFMRRKAMDVGITCLTDRKIVKLFVESIEKLDMGKKIHILSYDEFIKTLLLSLISIYQKIFSPDHSFWARSLNKPPYCKHIPSCSDYMKEAIEKK